MLELILKFQCIDDRSSSFKGGWLEPLLSEWLCIKELSSNHSRSKEHKSRETDWIQELQDTRLSSYLPENALGDSLQPACPALEAGLLLQRGLEALLEPGDGAQVAAAHPARLLLHVGEVHPVKVCEHLGDLLLVLENRPGCLGQVIQTSVPPVNEGSLNTVLSLTDWPLT